MSGATHALVALLALGSIFFMARLVRVNVLKAKYSILWLTVGAAMAIAAAAPGFLDKVAERLGIGYQPTLFLLLAIGFLLLLAMHFSYELSRMERRIRSLAEELALLRARTQTKGTDAESSDG